MQAMNSLTEIIRAETARRGVLPFTRYMELALYHPGLGYYETQTHSPGRRGDFYTSVSTGDLFGHLLACRFAGWLEEMRSAERGARIVEAGAHDGKLAGDILKWLQLNRPKLFDQIEYGIIEPSPRRQAWQRETLKMFAPRVRWFSDFQELAKQGAVKSAIPHSEFRTPNLSGIIFSNELLDAFPVRRLGWDTKNKNWFEWGVAVDGDKFVWVKISTPQSALCTPQLEAVLPDGYAIETSPAAENWWREAAGVLARGKLMAIDYGFTAAEMFSPARIRGTLRAYYRHHVTDDVLANPGEQDLTAHVNYSAIQKAGEEAGLTTEYFGSQAKFLVNILAAPEKYKSLGELVAPKPDEGGWSAKETRQFQTLTHPEHLGRAFRVLVQSR
jgi:SAM-dependent MidA family methyltransferase